jgi:hypothetical protein
MSESEQVPLDANGVEITKGSRVRLPSGETVEVQHIEGLSNFGDDEETFVVEYKMHARALDVKVVAPE